MKPFDAKSLHDDKPKVVADQGMERARVQPSGYFLPLLPGPLHFVWTNPPETLRIFCLKWLFSSRTEMLEEE